MVCWGYAWEQGDYAFCFVTDRSKSESSALWWHGTADTTFIEEALSPEAVVYAIRMNPWNEGPGDAIATRTPTILAPPTPALIRTAK